MNIKNLIRSTGLALLFSTAMAHAADAPPTHDRTLYEAVQVARQMMASKDIYDRILAAGALSDVGDTKALEVLQRCLTVDDTVVQRSAIDTLITATHPNSIDLLFKTASERPEVLALMAESLASVPRDDMGELLVKALHQESDFVKRHALQALVRARGADESVELQKLLAEPKSSNVIKAYASYALLAEGHKEMGKDFVKAATSGNADIREVAAVALGLVDSKDARSALKQLAKEKDTRVALAAVASHAGLGDEDSQGRIIQTIGYGTPMEATVMAGALKRLPPKMALQLTQALIGCCKLKGDAATRVLESWGFINADATSVYAWGLNHAEADVRMQTIWMIGQRKDANAIPLLKPFLTDEDPGIRGMAAWSIIHMNGGQYVEGIET